MAEVKEPKRWSCDTPHLYTAKVQVKKDGKILDDVTEHLAYEQ